MGPPKYRVFHGKQYRKTLDNLSVKEAREYAADARRNDFFPQIVYYKAGNGKVRCALYIRATRSLLYKAGKE